MPSNHLILCRPLFLLPSIFPNIRVISNESPLCIRWPKCWSFTFNINPSNEHPRLISFRIDWLDLLAVQGTLKSLLQHHSSKASVHWHSAFFIVKPTVFPAAMYRCESWTIKRAECQRIHAFKLWCWTRLLRVPWTARRSSQSILKEINPDYSLKGLILKLQLQYFVTWCKELTHWKGPWCWERLRTGAEGGDRRWDGWMASPTQWTWVRANPGGQWRAGRPGVLQSMGLQNWTRLSEGTTDIKRKLTGIQW